MLRPSAPMMLFGRNAGLGSGLTAIGVDLGSAGVAPPPVVGMGGTPAISVPFVLGAAVAKNNKNNKRKKKKKAAGASASVPEVAKESTAVVAAMAEAPASAEAEVVGAVKTKKKRCAFCKGDTHDSKECTADHYCYICDKKVHPTARCPTLRLPKPYAGIGGIGSDETMFNHLPDGIVKPHLAPSLSPIAIVTVTGEAVSAEVVQTLVARISRCRLLGCGRLFPIRQTLS